MNRVTTVKKRMAALVCAAAIALAMPVVAWADPSPEYPGTPGGDQGSTTMYRPGYTHECLTLGTFEGSITGVSRIPTKASNVPADAICLGGASWEVDGDATNVNLQFSLKDYCNPGDTVTVFIQHGNGDLEQQVKTADADGIVSVHVDRLSIFTIALGDYGNSNTAAGNGTVKSLDATSPKTGADLGGVVGVTALATLAAGAAFVALRKKIAE